MNLFKTASKMAQHQQYIKRRARQPKDIGLSGAIFASFQHGFYLLTFMPILYIMKP